MDEGFLRFPYQFFGSLSSEKSLGGGKSPRNTKLVLDLRNLLPVWINLQADVWYSQRLTWCGFSAWWQAGTAWPPPLAGALERDMLLRVEERRLQQSTNKTQNADFHFRALRQTNIQALGSYWEPRSASCAAEFLPVFVQFLYKIPAFWRHGTDKNMAKLSVINLSKK